MSISEDEGEALLAKMIADQEAKTTQRQAESAKKKAQPKNEFDTLRKQTKGLTIEVDINDAAFAELEAQSNHKRMLELKEKGVKHYQNLVKSPLTPSGLLQCNQILHPSVRVGVHPTC